MRLRVAVAAVAIPAAFILVYSGGLPLVLALGALAGLGAMEFYQMAEARAYRPAVWLGLVGALMLPPAVWWITRGGSPALVGGAALAWFLGVLLWVVGSTAPGDGPLESASVTIFGAVYPAMIAFVIPLRHGAAPESALASTWLVFLPLVTTWLCDSLAMGVGSLVGGARCAPVISPNKTWSGTLGGLVGAVLVSLLYGTFLLRAVGVEVHWTALLLIGLAVGVFGQAGDLVESAFKRSVGLKDSGRLFPGHGGVLDRLDSLYWGVPLTYVILRGYGTI